MRLAALLTGIGVRTPWRGNSVASAVNALDPDLDDERIVDLTTNWLYANPLLYTLCYMLVFLRQAAVPTIASILDRNGSGPIVVEPRQRNAATLAYFGTWFRYGYRSPRGQRAIAEVNAIHSRFPISQTDYRYVLATQVFEPDRLLTQICARPLTSTESRARFVFWRNLGRCLGIDDIPDNATDLHEWMLDYERQHYHYTEAGGRVATALREEWTNHHLPTRLHPLGATVVDALLDPTLARTLRIAPPHPAITQLTHTTIRTYIDLLRRRCPSPHRYLAGLHEPPRM